MIDHIRKEVCVTLSERPVEGAEGGGKLKNLVFVMRLTQPSVMTAHQAWILGVKTVSLEFARGWQSLAQDGVIGDFDPEKLVVQWCRAGVIESTAASSVDPQQLILG